MHKLIILVAGTVLAVMAARARAEPPTAQEILDQVRLQQSQQQLDLQGQLRSDATVIPFRITQTGPVIRYTFASPPEVLQLRLGEKSSNLDLVLENSTKKFAASRLDDKIGGTAVTYGDLALKFLYWPTHGNPGRGNHSHSRLLETAPPAAIARRAILERSPLGRQGKRRHDANRRPTTGRAGSSNASRSFRRRRLRAAGS